MLSFSRTSGFKQRKILFLVLVFEVLCCTAEVFLSSHRVRILIVLQIASAAYLTGRYMALLTNSRV